MAQHATGAGRQQLPGHQVAVMLHHREQHLVAGAQVGLTPGAGHQVDRLAGIAGVHDLAGTGRPHEGRHLLAGMLKALGGAGAELVSAAMHVGVVVAVVMLQRLQHLAGLLAGGGVIQIDQRLAQASDLAQEREIGAGEGREILGGGIKRSWGGDRAGEDRLGGLLHAGGNIRLAGEGRCHGGIGACAWGWSVPRKAFRGTVDAAGGRIDRHGGEGHGRGASSANTIARGCQIAAAAGSSRSTSPQYPRNKRREALAAAMPRLWR